VCCTRFCGTPIARLLSKEEDLKRTEDKVGEGDDPLPPFPDDTSDKHGRRESPKKYCHVLSLKLIDCAKLPDVVGYSSARDYILTCKGWSSYYAACCKVRSAMEDYNWKATSLLTYCKGGGLSKPKKNYNRQP